MRRRSVRVRVSGLMWAFGPTLVLLLLSAGPVLAAGAAATGSGPAFSVEGDAIPAPLPGTEPGDASRGRSIVASRQTGLCLLCHNGPFPEERFQGTLAPSLAGAGGRYSVGQLRLRIADGRRLNPLSVMPSYARTDGLERVGPAWRGKPVLTPQQIEDVVAFLGTLRQ